MKKKIQQNTKNQALRENERLKQENLALRQENEELKRKLALKKLNERFRKPKKLNESEVKEVQEMRKEGQTNSQIGKKFGVTEGTIRNYLKRK